MPDGEDRCRKLSASFVFEAPKSSLNRVCLNRVCLLSRAAVNSKMGVERNRFPRGMDEGAFGYIAGAGGAGRK